MTVVNDREGGQGCRWSVNDDQKDLDGDDSDLVLYGMIEQPKRERERKNQHLITKFQGLQAPMERLFIPFGPPVGTLSGQCIDTNKCGGCAKCSTCTKARVATATPSAAKKAWTAQPVQDL